MDMKRMMVIALAALSLISTAQQAGAAPGDNGEYPGDVIGRIGDGSEGPSDWDRGPVDGRSDWDRGDGRDDGRGGRDDRDGRGGRDPRDGRGGRDDRGGRGGRDDGRGGRDDRGDSYGRVALTRYYSQRLADHWVTTYQPNEWSYRYEQTLGFLITSPAPGFRPIYECLVGGRDHMLSVQRDCERQQGLGIAGYIRTSPTRSTRELYRCLTRDGRSHFATLDPSCEGQRREGLLGYIDQR